MKAPQQEVIQKAVVDDLEVLLSIMPLYVQQPLRAQENISDLLEVILDLGRPPEARFLGVDVYLDSREVTEEDLRFVVNGIGNFGGDNRAGIERTLHRFSAIRNRKGKVIGITCRVGRAVFGTINQIDEFVRSGQSILLLGRPGVGKTTMLREVARVLADEVRRRVVVVDTSNEIAGDGDIPHPGIGHARRMQVQTPSLQHDVMIEAVENHMPEVIIIDEIGTELETEAARTIAERGVQLIATAHGNTLENLIMNPTLSDLVGGVQTVILGDDEARRRRTQKTILERKRPPTFDVVVEIKDWENVVIHSDVAMVVDAWLRGTPPPADARWPQSRDRRQPPSEQIRTTEASPPTFPWTQRETEVGNSQHALRLYSFGVSRGIIEQTARSSRLGVELTDNLKEADLLVTSRAHYRRNSQLLKSAEEQGVPVHVLRKNTRAQVEQFVRRLGRNDGSHSSLGDALQEAQDAVEHVWEAGAFVELSPQRSYIRRQQHLIASRYNVGSQSIGVEPDRRVMVFRPPTE